MTLLGEFLLPTGGSAWTQTLVAALELQGLRDKAARQVLSRTEARGWITRERVGRQTRWSLTPAAEAVLTPGAERLYSFGQQSRTWDQRWLLVFASVLESDRASRYRMAQGLNWAGFGPLRQGVWLSPWTDTEGVAVRVLSELGIEATTFHAEVGQLGTAEALANQAWNLTGLKVEYDGFLRDVSTVAASTPENDAATLTELVHRWRRFPLIDPDLPVDLLAADWPGHIAAKHFGEKRAELLQGARQWWDEQEQAHSPTGWSS